MMPKQNLSPYEKALVSMLFAVITLVLEVVFVYQYATSNMVKFSPTAYIRGDGAFYFVIILGLFASAYLPYAINKFRDALKDD